MISLGMIQNTKWLEMPNYQVTFPFQKLQSIWNDQMTLRNSMTHQYSTHEDHFEWPKTPNDQITIHFTFKWLQIPNYHMKFPFRNIYLKVTWKTKWLWNTWWLQKYLSLGGYIQIWSRMTIHWKIRKENDQKNLNYLKTLSDFVKILTCFSFFFLTIST